MLQPSGLGKGAKSAIIGLGSNLAHDQSTPLEILQEALTQLIVGGVEIKAVSRFYSTPCFPVGAGPDFVNAAAMLATNLSATQLLAHLHRVEQALGRQRIQRWGQRTLDLDLLTFDDEIAPDLAGYLAWHDLPISEQTTKAPQQMILPHPRLQDRAFVLVPMRDIAADWQHPVTKRSTRQMLADLDPSEIAQIVPL